MSSPTHEPTGPARFYWCDWPHVYELVEPHRLSSEERAHVVQFHHRHHAQEVLSRHLELSHARPLMRDKLDDTLGFGSATCCSDEQLCEQLALALELGVLVLLKRPDPVMAPAAVEKLTDMLLGPRALSWIKVEVLWADTREPVPGLTLDVTTADSEQRTVQTNERGLAQVQQIVAGACQVSCRFLRLRANECVRPVTGGARSGASAPASSPRGVAKPRAVVEVEAHKVRSGETLAGLARAAGLDWQELAYFNWGVREPRQINLKLAHDVGCTRKTRDGKNYLFDDGDSPGIIFLPRAFRRSGLATTQVHTILVERVTPPPLDEDVVLSLPRDRVEVVQGHRDLRLLSRHGNYDERLPPENEDDVADSDALLYYRFAAVPVGVCDVLARNDAGWQRVLTVEVRAHRGAGGEDLLERLKLDTVEQSEGSAA